MNNVDDMTKRLDMLNAEVKLLTHKLSKVMRLRSIGPDVLTIMIGDTKFGYINAKYELHIINDVVLYTEWCELGMVQSEDTHYYQDIEYKLSGGILTIIENNTEYGVVDFNTMKPLNGSDCDYVASWGAYGYTKMFIEPRSPDVQ